MVPLVSQLYPDAADLLRRDRPEGDRRTAQDSSYEKMIVSGPKNHYTH